MRDAPAISIAEILFEAGANVKGYDPVSMKHAAQLMPDLALCDTPYEVAEGCDALVVITEWNEFKNLDMEKIYKSMKQPVIIDGRNLYEPEIMTEHGFTYRGIGRGYNGASGVDASANGRASVKQTS